MFNTKTILSDKLSNLKNTVFKNFLIPSATNETGYTNRLQETTIHEDDYFPLYEEPWYLHLDEISMKEYEIIKKFTNDEGVCPSCGRISTTLFLSTKNNRREHVCASCAIGF